MKAYGIEDPSEADNPVYGRASSLQYYKKAISYFMETNQAWSDLSPGGNPTKSRKINRLLSAVEKKETKGLGKDSEKDDPLTCNEFEQLIEIFKGHSVSNL